MKKSTLPKGWTQDRVRRDISHYERQTEAQAVAEDEAAFAGPPQTEMKIPRRLLPAVRELLAKYAG